ncbi:hypothetical protein P280DRAFT_478351 [Massarina eburnea CBS 473.64]|uniref:Uncharacterized protein n=1 Tax=Massarina eburnea CBS 473.64 TaxID=1395130 RepID=A0A6A6S7N3_9PLEO|nr:hypothetical protein P280DRAFT_478351 [Massarina eburnea CBS 473.64]
MPGTFGVRWDEHVDDSRSPQGMHTRAPSDNAMYPGFPDSWHGSRDTLVPGNPAASMPPCLAVVLCSASPAGTAVLPYLPLHARSMLAASFVEARTGGKALAPTAGRAVRKGRPSWGLRAEARHSLCRNERPSYDGEDEQMGLPWMPCWDEGLIRVHLRFYSPTFPNIIMEVLNNGADIRISTAPERRRALRLGIFHRRPIGGARCPYLWHGLRRKKVWGSARRFAGRLERPPTPTSHPSDRYARIIQAVGSVGRQATGAMGDIGKERVLTAVEDGGETLASRPTLASRMHIVQLPRLE